MVQRLSRRNYNSLYYDIIYYNCNNYGHIERFCSSIFIRNEKENTHVKHEDKCTIVWRRKPKEKKKEVYGLELYANNESTNYLTETQNKSLILKLGNMIVESKDTLNLENKTKIIWNAEYLRHNSLIPLLWHPYLQVLEGWLRKKNEFIDDSLIGREIFLRNVYARCPSKLEGSQDENEEETVGNS